MATGALWRVPLDGGTPSIILAGLDGPARIAIEGSTIYWTESHSGLVRRAVPGGVVGEVLASGRDQPRDIGVDGGTVYWLEEPSDGGLFFLADSIGHAIRAYNFFPPWCDLVSGEADPMWLATGYNGNSNLYILILYGGFHVFWVEGARIRRITTTSTHAWGTWCE